MSRSPAIQLTGLSKAFGEKIAVAGIDLRVDEGEFFGFLGPNGAGKSTTINMLVGLLRPDGGSAFIHGVDVWKQPLEAKQLRGVVPEGLALFQRLTGREYVRFVGTIYGLAAEEAMKRTDDLMQLLDMGDDADRMIVDYSHGMQKKTALAAAVVHAPRVLFLDEPFEGIDAIARRSIHDVLQRLRARGTTIFFSSHILEVVERLCTRMAVISEGKIVASGTMDELRSQEKAGTNATLEDVFLRAVGAEGQHRDALSWLD
ncbi:MAG TPA: ABC transporter ATP-binding protein [Candidatus Krumholzibacteria bacterium]|nr:ABC transporter ATP-binding protein [Candidatus Krumholzibacteria bacterium]